MVGQTEVIHSASSGIRSVLLDVCNTKSSVAVFLSSGIDSNAVLAAYLLNDVRPLVVSFCLDHSPSTDFRSAQDTAKREGLDFLPVFLPTDLDSLIEDVKMLIRYGAKGKAEIEAFWGCWHALREVNKQTATQVVATGLGAGALFGDGRDPAIRGHGPDGDDPSWLDELRAEKFGKENYAQSVLWQKVCEELGLEEVRPYHDPRLQELMKGHSWISCNGIREKKPLHDAFPETAKWKIKKHTNLQLGDSGISALFSRLVQHPINTSGFKSVVGIYNSLVRHAK